MHSGNEAGAYGAAELCLRRLSLCTAWVMWRSNCNWSDLLHVFESGLGLGISLSFCHAWHAVRGLAAMHYPHSFAYGCSLSASLCGPDFLLLG
jgi:hypothetical protein